MRPCYPGAVLTAIGLCAIGVPAAAQLSVADSTGIQVNTYTTNHQERPEISALPSGGFVVTWYSVPTSVYAQRYDAAGLPDGTELLVTADAPAANRSPAVAALVDGSFVIAAEGCGGNLPGPEASCGIVAQRYDAAGVALGDDIHVNTFTSGREGFPEVTATADGGFVVVWMSNGTSSPAAPGGDGDAGGVFGQRFDSAGAPAGTEFAVNTYTTGHQFASGVASAPDGSFLVVWEGRVPGSDDPQVRGRVFDPTGAPATGEIVINSTPVGRDIGHQGIARAAADALGNYTVAWAAAPSSELIVQAQRLESSGALLGPELTVTTSSLNSSWPKVKVAAAPDGRFVVTWVGAGTGADPDEHIRVLASAYDSTGQLEQGDIVLTSYLYTEPRETAVAMSAGGSFMTVWTEGDGPNVTFGGSRDGHDFSLFARRVCRDDDPTCRICAGADNAQNADGDRLSDGCDVCTDVDGLRSVALRSRLTITDNDDSSVPQRTNRIAYAAEYVLPVTTSFAQFDPLADGMRVRIDTAGGRHVVDLALPAGPIGGAGTAGWSGSASGNKWKFKDRTDSFGKIGSLSVLDRSKRTPGAVKLKLKSRGLAVDLNGTEAPLRVTTVLGGPSNAAAGMCGEIVYADAECSVSGTRTRCDR